MKTNTIYLALGLFSAILMNSGCNNADKDASYEDSTEFHDSVVVATEEKIDSIQVTQNEDWLKFKAEAQAQISKNNARIDELRAKQSKDGKLMDNAYSRKIDRLKEKNEEMNKKIESFDSSKSDWEKFKEEFNHDMDEIGKAFKGLGESSK